MRVLDVAGHRTVAIVEPDTTVADAARIMLTCDARVAVVASHGRPVGILTDRDIVARVVTRELPLSTPVGAVMTIVSYLSTLYTFRPSGASHLAPARFRVSPGSAS